MASFPPQIRTSLAAKLGVAVVGVAVVLSGAGAWLLDQQGSRAVDQTTLEHMAVLTSAVEGSFQVYDKERKSHPIGDMVAEVGRHPAVSTLQVFDHAFTIRHSLSTTDRGKTLSPQERVEGSTRAGAELTLVRYFAPRAQCTTCHAGQQTAGGVRIVVERARIQGALWEFRVMTGMTGAGIIAAVLLLVVLLTRRMIIDPIRALSTTMGTAEDGDFLVRARVVAEDELGALARAFNTMLAAITDLRAQELERGQTLAQQEAERRVAPQLVAKERIIESQNTLLQTRLRDLQLLQEVTRNLTSTLSLEEQLNIISRLLAERLGYQEFSLMLMDKPAGLLRMSAAHGFPAAAKVHDTTFEMGEGVAGLVAQSGQAVLVSDTSADNRYVDKARTSVPGTLLCVPMVNNGQVMGVINIFKPQVGAFDRAEQELIESVAKQAALAIANAQLFESTVEQSLTDALTSLPNRRSLDMRLELELARAQRYGHPMAVLMVDVDHFKSYNDRFGHLEGDKVLRMVAQALVQSVRKTDAVARFGGEEFCVVLPRQDVEAATDVANKLRMSVRARRVPHADELEGNALTVSVGVAAFPRDGQDALALLAAADGALYAAKRSGRDRVVSTADAAVTRGKET